MVSYFNVYHITLHPSIPLASYFFAIHHLGKLFSCFGWSYFRADHITLHSSILLASYFCAVHPLRELFSCLPFYSPSFGESFFVLSNPWESYFRAYYLIIHPFASYFRADHLTLHPSIPLASYFCTVQPLGELFSCLLFDSPSFGELFWC